MANRKFLPISLLALGALTPYAMTQSASLTTSDVRGTVVGADGKAIANATITLTSEATNQVRTAVSSADGTFAIRLLNPGTYSIAVEAQGFAARRLSGVNLRLASTLELPITMGNEATATVDVLGSNTMVDRTRTQIAATIDNNFINNLPINKRDFTSFSLTAPGVTEANGPESRKGGAATDSGLSFAGINPRSNNIMVDGMDNNDISVGSARTTFGQDSIQEFQVVTNGFGAEYGRASGGTLNIITKSGGNEYRGSLFNFSRRGKYDAKMPLSGGVQSSLKQDQYGFTIGGPIIKDTMFYFISVEKLQKTDSATVAFSSNASNNAAIIAAIGAKGYTVASGPVAYKEGSTTNLIKLDYLLSPNQRVSARYTYANEFNGKQLDFGGQVAKSGGGARSIEDQAASFSHQFVGSNFVNELRVGVSKRDHSLLSLDSARTPYVRIIGVATFGTQRFLPQDRTEKTKQVADTLSFSLGAHTFKLGFDNLETNVAGVLPLNFAGYYTFGGFPAATGIPYADGLTAFNNNAPLVFAQAFGQSSLSYNSTFFSSFLQDDWQLTPSFTLKLGLRYDREALPDMISPSTGQVAAAYTYLANPNMTTSLGANIGPSRIATSLQAYKFNSMLTPEITHGSSRTSPRLSFNYQASPEYRFYGGYGVFSGRTNLGPAAALLIANMTDMRTYVLQGANAFAVFSNALGNTNRRFQNEPTANPSAGIYPSVLLPGKFGMSRSIQTNVGMEYTPASNVKWTLDLIHSNGDGFLQVRDANASVTNPYANFAAANSASNPWVRRPELAFGPLYLYDGSGASSYNALSLGMMWQLDNNFAMNANYTFSRSMDNYIDWLTDYAVNNTFDPSAEQGPSNQDQRHRFNLSMVYKKNDWTLSMIGRLASGRPWNVGAGADLNNNGDGGLGDRPAGVSRNSEVLPSNHNIDLRVSRMFRLGGKQRIELIADVFNVTNHYNVSRVQNIAALSATFGQPVIQSFDFNRQVQVGARWSW